MTMGHLSADEVVAALDDELVGARAEHIASCASCREAVESARAVVREIAAAEVPEPSPLFWDHFSARVRQATAAETPRPVGWRPAGWQFWAFVTSALGAVLVTLVLRQPGPSVPAEGVRGAVASAPVASRSSVPVPVPVPTAPAVVPVPATVPSVEEPVAEAEPWTEVVQLASALSSDDVHGLLPQGESSSLVDDLTANERAAFVRLLNEMEARQ